MSKNFVIILLGILLVSSWLWPRYGFFSAPLADGSLDPPESADPEAGAFLGPYAELEQRMAAMQAAPGFEAASLGLCVFAGDAHPVFTYRAEEAMTPASTLKVVTSATALERLGPDYRFETRLGATQAFELDPEGAFDGDLVIEGGGDPMLSSVTLAQWVGALGEKGLKKLRGRVVADARCFPEHFTPNAWDWGDVSNYYGAGASGLNLDLNRFTVAFDPAERVGDSAMIASVTPALAWLERHNLVTTGDAGSEEWTSIYGGPYAATLTFRGSIPIDGGTVSSRGAIPDPAYHAARQFSEMLGLVGIEVAGEVTTARRLERERNGVPERVETLMTHESESLEEIVRYLHRTSDNMVTECLLQKLIEVDPLGGPGQAVVMRHWEERGLRFDGLRMEDGSGLARADYIRPKDLAELLWLTRRGPQGEIFLQSLNAYHGGRLHWKGGAMSKVRAYAGYTDNGYTFALMINNYDTDPDTLAAWRTKIVESLLYLPPEVPGLDSTPKPF